MNIGFFTRSFLLGILIMGSWLSGCYTPQEDKGPGGSNLVVYRGVISDPFGAGATSSLGFGEYYSRYGGYHAAIDLNAQVGDLANAPCSGRVVEDLTVAGYGSACDLSAVGWVTMLECSDEALGYTVLLGHCRALGAGSVVRGSPVCEIQPFPGPDCVADWSHLHLSVRYSAFDDLKYRGYASAQELVKYWVDPTTAPAIEVEQPAACGNGRLDAGEACDGSLLNGRTCASLGYDGGTLACSVQCTFDASGCTTATEVIGIESSPAPGVWTPDFVTSTDCSCSVYSEDCHTLYRGQVSSISGNRATLRFKKASNLSAPVQNIHYWVVVTEETYPTCLDTPNYVTRVEGTWPAGTAELVVSQVPVWPSVEAFETAVCGSQKALFIITGGSNGLNDERIWFQKQTLVFTKTCE